MEWEKYRCGEPNVPFSLRTSLLLKDVYHVSHLNSSFGILQNKSIRAGLIHDGSVLNKERILVTWVSPNYYPRGSIYGNVSFAFDFATLVQGKNFYWVEVVEYKNVTLRILITQNNYDHRKDLFRYNPEKDNGPWIMRDGKHYWTNDYPLHFMLEQDLSLRKASEISFVDHHSDMCKVDVLSCPHKGLTNRDARIRFIATILANSIPVVPKHFVKVTKALEIVPASILHDGVVDLLGGAYTNREVCAGTITSKSQQACGLVLAALFYRSKREMTFYKQMLSLFASYEHFEKVLLDIVVERFKLPGHGCFDLE